jgi:energy-coupling factor transporter transmembrane protein EcfT
MIFLEISVSVAVTSEIPRQLLVQLFTFGVLIVGTLEGLLTAIVSSYYYSRRKRSYTGVRHSPVVQYEDISFTDLGVGRPEDILITDIKGSTGSLDPRSKILITLFFILGTAISLDYFQVFLYLLIYIPILILFRPRLVFFKRLIFPFILILFVSFVLYLGIEGSEVPINIFNYHRTYTKEGFIGLIIYRYMTIILFNFMLLHSEPSHTDIIEALASFRLGTSIITILLLIKRISTTVSSDLAKMSFAAQSKGAFGKNPARNIFVRMQILGRTLVRSVSHSESISKSLIARGFHDNFVPTIRPWSSEGVSVTILSGILCVCITVIPWLR